MAHRNRRHRIIDMAKRKEKPKSVEAVLLGEKLFALREGMGIARKALGRRVKVTEQQIAKYEAGDLVPMAMLERLCEELDAPIQKKYIRRISDLRHEIKKHQDDAKSDAEIAGYVEELRTELCELYEFVFYREG